MYCSYSLEGSIMQENFRPYHLMRELAKKPLYSSYLPERTGITPLPESLKLAVTTPITQQNTDDLLFADLFAEEKTNVSSVIASVSAHGYDTRCTHEQPTVAIASPLMGNINASGALIEVIR